MLRLWPSRSSPVCRAAPPSVLLLRGMLWRHPGLQGRHRPRVRLRRQAYPNRQPSTKWRCPYRNEPLSGKDGPFFIWWEEFGACAFTLFVFRAGKFNAIPRLKVCNESYFLKAFTAVEAGFLQQMAVSMLQVPKKNHHKKTDKKPMAPGFTRNINIEDVRSKVLGFFFRTFEEKEWSFHLVLGWLFIVCTGGEQILMYVYIQYMHIACRCIYKDWLHMQ